MISSPSSLVHLDVDSTYLPEVWAWFVFGVLVISLRYVVRIRTVGIRNFAGDDYLMLLVLALWTIDAVIVEITYYTGGSIDVTPEVLPYLSERDIAILMYGTKWEYASFFTYSGLIWALKFSVLCFYQRLRADEWRQTWLTVHCLGWINCVAYIALCLTALLSCRPFHDNWAVKPLPPLRCTFRPQNFWTLVVLNVLTDALILSLPLPILWRLRVSRLRKLGVTLLLCSGLFLIATAIVRAAFTIAGSPSIITINRWGFRETAAGVAAINAPILAPLFSKAFWRHGPYRPGRNISDQAEWAPRVADVAGANRPREQRRSLFAIPSSFVVTKTTARTSTAKASNVTGLSGPSKERSEKDLQTDTGRPHMGTSGQ